MNKIMVKVGQDDLFKVLDYLYKDERKDYYTMIEEKAAFDECNNHIFQSIIRLAADAKMLATDFLGETDDTN